MRNVLIVLVSLALLGLLEAAYYALRYVRERRGGELRRRLHADGGATPLSSTLLRQGRFASLRGLDAFLAAQPWARRVEHLLEQADSRMTVAQVVGFTILGAVMGGLAGFWLGLPAGLLLGAAAAAVPWLALRLARERRGRQLSEQLPEAVDMMARSLRAGHAMTSAFQLVAGEMPEPIAIEFARAYEEQRLGMPLERAVREMAARAPSNGDLKIFAVSTVIQKETGGNLAEILDGIAHTVRERYRFFGKLRALTAEARISALIVSLLPLAMALFLVVTQPAYMVRLVDNDMGRTILAGGIAAWLTGAFWFQRLTRFDF
ncbi:MAG TPA: type II secretion system F family protein [Anaeromyxobacteraceae bacterium]|nr:type II secretion system F family protein [Anaeromyxobacteraceae bacterium]